MQSLTIHRRSAFLAALVAFVLSTAALMALTETADAQLGICQRRPLLPQCQELPEPPESITPVLHLDVARESTDRSHIQIGGWAADPDAPHTPLTIKILYDGVEVASRTADGSRPDVGAAYPHFGPAHGYDAVLRYLSARPQQVCVVAVDIGGGANARVCKSVDDILEFEANDVHYDVANRRIAATNLDALDRVSNVNDTAIQQSTTVSGERSVTETQGWSDTLGLKVTVKTAIPIPFLTSPLDVSVEGSKTFTQNGSTSSSRRFSWTQPVNVPARSEVVASVAVARSTLVVPYTLSGDFVYRSGHRAGGSVGGSYTGVNSYDLKVRLTQYDLNGTPAASPAPQPAPTRLESH